MVLTALELLRTALSRLRVERHAVVCLALDGAAPHARVDHAADDAGHAVAVLARVLFLHHVALRDDRAVGGDAAARRPGHRRAQRGRRRGLVLREGEGESGLDIQVFYRVRR